MQGLRNIINHFRYIKGNNTVVAAFFVLGLGLFGFAGLNQLNTAQAATLVRNCDNNAIMYCGAANAAEFKQKFMENKTGDLPAIYGHYWIPSDIQVVQGTSHKDGTVRVNGKVVATDAQSIGRQNIPGSHAITIAGKTYYESPNSTALKTDGLPTLVALDANGNFKYAIIAGCGNPVYAKPVPPTPPKQVETPKYACTYLNVENLSATKKRFTARSTASGGATANGFRIDYGDGKTEDFTSTATREYVNTGDITVRVTAKFMVDGKAVEATSAACEATFTIAKPTAESECKYLTATRKEGNTYKFVITKAEKNAVFKGAKMDYGDGTVENITGTEATHTFTTAGTYTVTATLSFDVDGQVISRSCTASVTTEVCEYDSTLPKDSPNCKAPVTPTTTTPTEMPQTGMGSLIASGLGLGSLIVSGSFYLASRRDLLSALLGR